jgi:hypothetical protein
MDKKVPFKISETDVQKIKEHLSSKASSKAGNSVIFSDNSGADKMAKGGKLVGKQKKLDVNHNGKLDAEDFKMLRGDKMAKGGKIASKAKYIPKYQIEEVEVDINGKEKEIDGADLLNGLYVKKAAYERKSPVKKAKGGEVKPKSKRKGGDSVGKIAVLAKQIRKEGEKWTDAIKRASAQLKKA